MVLQKYKKNNRKLLPINLQRLNNNNNNNNEKKDQKYESLSARSRKEMVK